MLELTLRGLVPQIFGGYAGHLDSAGKATASVLVPNHAALMGFTFHTAFVTLSATAPSGVKTVSESRVVRIQ